MAKYYYIRGEVVPFEEDFLHEFKGHRNICVEDLPPWTLETKTERASRRAVSRTLNAFLNTGKGGTVYLGVIDSGVVRGLQLTEYQKQHVIGSMKDLLTRYNPPVKEHRYRVKFVPVVDNRAEGDHLVKMGPANPVHGEFSDRAHVYRSHAYCWCDKDSIMQYNAGISPADFVIEIKIKPWAPDDPLNKEDGCGSLTNIHPIHEDEEGNCYFRRQASLKQYSLSEIAQLSRQEVQESCYEKIERLTLEVDALERHLKEGT